MGSSSLSVTSGAIDDQNTVERDDDTIAGYSSRGPRRDNNDGYPYDELKPDVSASGSNIVQAQGCYTSGGCSNSIPGQDASDNGYSGRGSGTSYATPSVAGVMALLLEVNGNLTPAVVREILRTTAEPRGEPTYPELDPFWNRDFGWGMVDALLAVEEAIKLEDPGNVDVELQAHILETITNDSVVIKGVSWARLGNVPAVQYRIDGGPWRGGAGRGWARRAPRAAGGLSAQDMGVARDHAGLEYVQSQTGQSGVYGIKPEGIAVHRMLTTGLTSLLLACSAAKPAATEPAPTDSEDTGEAPPDPTTFPAPRPRAPPARCLAAAREQGFQVCYLETLQKMHRARALYKKLGFEALAGPMGDTGHFACDDWYALDL